MGSLLVKTMKYKYKCEACEKIEEISADDQRAAYPQTLCESCGSMMKRFVDKSENIGDIDEWDAARRPTLLA